MVAVNTNKKTPAWTWNGNMRRPTLSPSILTRGANDSVCHSFLIVGVFNFLDDCTHAMKGRKVEAPDLPRWFIEERM